MLFLSKITILHIFYRFGDHKKKKKIRHMRPHKLQPNEKCLLLMEFRCHGIVYYITRGETERLHECEVCSARVKRGLQSHEMLSLCFVSSNVYYFS